MTTIDDAVRALYRDHGLAALAFALTGSVQDGEALVRAGVARAVSRRWRPRRGLAERARLEMIALHCAAVRDTGAGTSVAPDPDSEAPVNPSAFSPPPAGEDEYPMEKAAGGSIASSADALSAVDRSVASLEPRVRTAMVLRYREERPVRDVARALGASEDDVDRLLAEGRAVLAADVGVSPSDVEHVVIEDSGS